MLDLLFEHLADLVDVVTHAAKDPNNRQAKEYGRNVLDCKKKI